MKIDKRILILLVIIAILSVGIAYELSFHENNDNKNSTKNTTIINNTTVKNATIEKSSDSTSGKYGYCAICGKSLTYDEAHNEYTQGKVCLNCAKNPDYQSGKGAEYANQKLYEAYPDEYDWMYEDSNEDYDYDYEDYEDYDYDDYSYDDEEY